MHHNDREIALNFVSSFKELTMDLILIGNVLEANRYFNKFTYLLYIRQLAMKRALANLIQSCLNSFKKNGEHTAFIEIEYLYAFDLKSQFLILAINLEIELFLESTSKRYWNA